MNVIIANTQKDSFNRTKIVDSEYKCATGIFNSYDCIRAISSLEVDYLIIDITAIKEPLSMSTWKEFKSFIDPEKTIILLADAKEYDDAGFLSMLIQMGYYNFTKFVDNIDKLMKTPNTHDDVSKYLKIALMRNDQNVSKQDYEEYLKVQKERQDVMRNYLNKQDNTGKIVEKNRARKVFKRQLMEGFIILPSLVILSICAFYCLEVLAYHYIPYDSSFGQALFKGIYGTNISPLYTLILFVTLIMFGLYYGNLNPFIKRNEKERGKYIVIPFSILVFIAYTICLFSGMMETLLSYIPFIDIYSIDYLYHDYKMLELIVTIIAVLEFYVLIAIKNSKTIRFEKNLDESFTLMEKIWCIFMTLVLFIPAFYLIATNAPIGASIESFAEMLFTSKILQIVIMLISLLCSIMFIFVEAKKVADIEEEAEKAEQNELNEAKKEEE